MLILGLISVFTLIRLSNKAIHNNITFHHKKDLTIKNISEKNYSKIYTNHQQCFEEVKRKNLIKYYIEKDDLKSTWDHRAVEKKVADYIERSRTESTNNFKYTNNVTIMKFKNKIIGHYSCSEENKITDQNIMISNVCLEKPMRGKGLGRKMLNNAIEYCSKKNQDLSLLVYKDDKIAINLYSKLGFIFTEPSKEIDNSFYFFNKILMIYKPEVR